MWNDNTGDIQYVEQGQNLAFTHAGMYKGNSFSKTYYNVLEDGTYNVTMAITSQMNPKNGVIEGYMVENFENKTPYVYIYLDEDWRKKVKFTNIIWGKDLQFIKKFEWKKVGDGVYLTKIEDDSKRFPEDFTKRTSAVFVGDITLDDTKKDMGAFTLMKLI